MEPAAWAPVCWATLWACSGRAALTVTVCPARVVELASARPTVLAPMIAICRRVSCVVAWSYLVNRYSSAIRPFSQRARVTMWPFGSRPVTAVQSLAPMRMG